MLRRVLRVLQGGIMFSVRVVQRRRCAHSQQVIEVQPNLGVHLVLGRLLGLEAACAFLDLNHRFVQRRVFDVDDQERDKQAGTEDAHHGVDDNSFC